ncbi:unnamed protein product, partial [Urochloa humidicola]
PAAPLAALHPLGPSTSPHASVPAALCSTPAAAPAPPSACKPIALCLPRRPSTSIYLVLPRDTFSFAGSRIVPSFIGGEAADQLPDSIWGPGIDDSDAGLPVAQEVGPAAPDAQLWQYGNIQE